MSSSAVTPARASFLPYLWYPLLMGGALVAFAALLQRGLPLTAVVYIPIIGVAATILLLEARFPQRQEWRPRRSDVLSDTAFLVFVQALVPQILAVLGTLTLSAWLHREAPSPLWPQSWPLAGQILLMIVLVDFMRYWMHRALHHVPWLWRLHEVHHSPDILYTLNVGRFHPFEKILQYGLDSVPFLLLGVGPEVLSGYFVVFSVNGFFQHCNVRVQYGWLNYVVGSAETHRWHHARDPRTAACNFSNTTIIWDLLFGTWFLPRDREVEIGIPDLAYPKDFRAQLVMPFLARNSGTLRLPLRERCLNTLIAAQARLTLWAEGRRLRHAIRDPGRVQRTLLRRILRENRQTTYGRRHGFADIQDYAQFVQRVPVADYEALRPFIAATIATGEAALTREVPVSYARTSGTAGQPKDVPLTESYLEALRRINRHALARQYRLYPDAFAGGMLAITSPAQEGALPNGRPFGSASGLISEGTSAWLQQKFVLPAAVLTVVDSRVKYLLILRLALLRPDLTYISTANPSTLLILLRLLRENLAVLLDDVRRGTFFLDAALPTEVRTAVAPRLVADPGRADELARLEAAAEEPLMAVIWPALRLLVTWTGAGAGVATGALRGELPAGTRVLDLGYVASEFRATITLGRRAGSGLPTLHTHVFEFVERALWDEGRPVFLPLEKLQRGREYYVVVTTPAGLYRYFINDVVRVTGFLHRLPLLQFVQKGQGVTNITGEKLSEAQVLAAVQAVARELGFVPRFLMMLADDPERRYRLYVEAGAPAPAAATLAAAVDARLGKLNVEYQAKRESGRLEPVIASWLRSGTGDAYRQHRVAQGQREAQFKVVALARRSEFKFNLESCVRDET